MTVIDLIEHGPESGELQLAQEDIDWLLEEKEIGEKEQKLKLISSNGRHKLKAKGHVGSIPLPSGKFIINIKPRFGNAWENLFKLFEYAEGIEPTMGERDVHAEAGDTLWDIIAKIFYRYAMQLINKGLYRTYVTKTEEITAIRGRLLLAQNIRSPQKFRTKHWCEFDELSYDVPENQYVLYCTTLLLRYVNSATIKQELIRIRNIILSQDVTLRHRFTSSDAKLITIHRMNKEYEKIFVYCKLILNSLAYKKFSDMGGVAIPPFTLSMWELFEKSANKFLVEHYRPQEIHVSYGKKARTKPILEHDQEYEPMYRMKRGPKPSYPDNIISSSDGKLILDTKWKDVPKSNDWYQATTYSLALKCDTIFLLPKVDEKYSDGWLIPKEYCEDCNDLTIHAKTIDFEEAAEQGDFIENLRSQIKDVLKDMKFKK